jgi:cytochrome c peroxidase
MLRPAFTIGPFLIVLAAMSAADPPPVPRDTLPEALPLDTVPLGLGRRTVPDDNPLTALRVDLGRKLFFDTILSADKTVACATCHLPERGFAGGRAKSRGIGGREGDRRAPTLLNRAFGTSFFWDGRASTLEQQALQPIENPVEMGAKVADVVARLKADHDYTKRFRAAFDDGVTAANLAKALAGFERALVRGDSPVDRFRANGDHSALTSTERHGLWLYESKALCWKCHSGPNFTDEGFHNTGVSWGGTDLGRYQLTNKDADRGRYKTPTLRGAVLRPPYMHDGSLPTLEAVVEFYNRGGRHNPKIDPVVKPLNLSPEEQQALVAFLKLL